MTDTDIQAARAVIAAKTPGPATWAHGDNETEEQAVEYFLLAYRAGKERTGQTGLHVVEVDRRDDGTCLWFAVTGNSTDSAANARYIVGSFDPVAGWAAALDEVVRLRALLRDVVAPKGAA
jgi:hypothetical protein